MTTPFLFWDIDTQHDFIDQDGKLPAPGAAGIVPQLIRLTRAAVRERVPIVATADAHAEGDPEFEEFGAHCVAGTYGQRKIPATSCEGAVVADPDVLHEQLQELEGGRIPQLVIEKQMLNAFDEPVAAKVLEALDPARIFVYGVATEYCVRVQTLSMLRRNRVVSVVRDAVSAIDEEDGRAAMEEMTAAGAAVTDTAAVLGLIASLGNQA